MEPTATPWGGLRSGLLWSLALLTKIHAWLLLPVMVVWTLSRHPWRSACRRLICWGVTGLVFFFAGWPWLWYDTWSHWKGYLGTSVHRATILVEYFGRTFADQDVPWHYPWFYFAVTVPVGLQVLGAYGLLAAWRSRRSDPMPLLLAGSILLFLCLFSTRVPVYDGERLFLHVFPAWAMLIGLGFGRIWNNGISYRIGPPVLALLLLSQCYGTLTLHPFGLSYYNALTGGLRGAEKLGLELTYWGDAVDHVLLDRLSAEIQPGSTAALAPSLYSGQGILTTTARLARRGVVLQDQEQAMTSEWVIVYRREAYWQPALRRLFESGQGRPVFLRTRQGVWLSSIWHFPRTRRWRAPAGR